MNSILLSQQIILEDRNENLNVANNLERLVADEAMQMEIINTVACMKVVSEDFPVKEIKEME